MRRLLASGMGAVLACALATASAQAADGNACGSGPHAILGRFTGLSLGEAARLGVLPDTPVGERYLGQLRTLLAARRSPGEALALVAHGTDFASTASSALASMRRAPVASDGSFRCGGLSPGRYLTVAFVSQSAGAQQSALDPRSLQIYAASATVGATYDAAIVGWTNLGGTP
ncbi:MAG: hypothetical protein ACLPSH_15555 [Vulcanimicrobiaceae bacterium]